MEQYNTGVRKDIRRFEKLASINEAARLSGVKGIMSVSYGRHWMHDLLSRCGVFHTPFAVDNATTNFNCGQQNIGLSILADIMAISPDEYTLMMREYNERTAAAAERSRSKDDDGGVEGSASDGADEPEPAAGEDARATTEVRRV